MSLYDQAFIYINGGLLGENLEVDSRVESDIAQVKTIPKGFNGVTPGSPVRIITIKNAVPITGPEYNFERALILSQPVRVKLQLGGSGQSTIMNEAYVIGPVTLSTALGKATEQDVTLVGKATPLE